MPGPSEHHRVRITDVRPKRGGRRVELYVDGEPAMEVGRELLHQLGIRKGEWVDQATLERLSREDAKARVRDAALRLLDYRPRAIDELRQRLLRKGHGPEPVEECIGKLADAGLLDDRAFAESFVRGRVRSRPRGPRLLSMELRRRGVGAAAAAAAVERVLEEEELSEPELARSAAERWAARAPAVALERARRGDSEELSRMRRRLLGHLDRRGFPAEVCRLVCDELLTGDR